MDIIHRSIKVADDNEGYKVNLGDHITLSFPYDQDGKQIFEAADKIAVILRKRDIGSVHVKATIKKQGSEGEISLFVNPINFIINNPENTISNPKKEINIFQKSYIHIKKGLSFIPAKLLRQEV